MAASANAAAAALAEGLREAGAGFLHSVDANMIFAEFPRAAHRRLHEAGAMYYVWSGALEGDDPEERLAARLVCDWSSSAENRERFLSILTGAARG
jgi:threonine aldolase